MGLRRIPGVTGIITGMVREHALIWRRRAAEFTMPQFSTANRQTRFGGTGLATQEQQKRAVGARGN